MPIIECKDSSGKNGYKVENTNGCPFTYSGGESARKHAKMLAYKQWYAIQQRQGNASEYELNQVELALSSVDMDDTSMVKEALDNMRPKNITRSERVLMDIDEYLKSIDSDISKILPNGTNPYKPDVQLTPTEMFSGRESSNDPESDSSGEVEVIPPGQSH